LVDTYTYFDYILPCMRRNYLWASGHNSAIASR